MRAKSRTSRFAALGACAMTTVFTACGGAADDLTAPPGDRGAAVRMTIKTTGTQWDMNGYVVMVNGQPRNRVRPNDTTSITNLPLGKATVELSDISPNCWIDGAEEKQTATIVAGYFTGIKFAVECFPFSQVARDDIPFGEFELETWEFFEDSSFTTLAYDLVHLGVSGRVLFTPQADSLLDWHFREAPGTFSGNEDAAEVVSSGNAAMHGDTLRANIAARSAYRYPLGDANGPLNGDYRFSLVGEKLVMTRLEPVGTALYDSPQSQPLWTRLTLIRRKNWGEWG